MTLPLLAGFVCAGALLLSLILSLSLGPRRVQHLIGWIAAPAGLIGLAFYTAAYLHPAAGGEPFVAGALRSVLATCLMFLGRNDAPSLLRLPAYAQSGLLQALFWLVHLAAFYVSTSAVLTTLGKKLLQTLRLRLSRHDSVYLVLALNPQSLCLIQDLARRKAGQILCVTPEAPLPLEEQAIACGAVVRQMPYPKGEEACVRLLRLVHAARGRRRLCILALDDSEGVNINLVHSMIGALRRLNIGSGQARLSLRSYGELDYGQLAAFQREKADAPAKAAGPEAKVPQYEVDAFSDAELAARLLIHTAPPYKAIDFDAEGRAEKPFVALVVGFGQVGQHALRQIVMNGQFYGSDFTALVVDKDFEQSAGAFTNRYRGMMAAYRDTRSPAAIAADPDGFTGIRFEEMDVGSERFYARLDAIAPRLTYIVVALGSDEASYELTANLDRYFARCGGRDLPTIAVSVCNRRAVGTTRSNIRILDKQQQVFSRAVLIRDRVDAMAMAVNLTYSEHNNEKRPSSDAIALWREADYFSRESSRASADFIAAMLHIAHLDEKETLDIPRDEEKFEAHMKAHPTLLENLTITEHMRWNAFHYAMGFTTMPLCEVAERGRRADRLRAENPQNAEIPPVQKDLDCLRHACLVDWDDLDVVSEAVAKAGHRSGLDYKAMDRNNVQKIPRTLGYESEL